VKVATWNVNSIRAREARVLAWCEREAPDVLALQELKCLDEAFPRAAFESLGYAIETHGQRTYNGVALLARSPIREVERGLLDEPAPQARLIAGTVEGVRVVCVYIPNGEAVGSPKFAYKLGWLERLRAWLEDRHDPAEPLLLLGDFNVAPEDRDCHDPDLWRGQVLFHPEERARLDRLRDWGLTDLFRLHHEEGGVYTWWDYRQLAFPRNAGLRIDLVLGTEAVAARCRSCEVDRQERKGKQPSDHAPVVAVLGG
jgi:exodeoxyribonuclease-3